MIREIPKSTTVRIRNLPVVVPIVENQAVTEALVTQLETRLTEIEEGAGRVDTQAFALRAAFDSLAELHQLRQEHEHDHKDLLKALSALSDRLQSLAEQASD